MAETLFDENTSGPQGNAHMAIGKSFSDCYNGDISKMKKRLGKIKLQRLCGSFGHYLNFEEKNNSIAEKWKGKSHI